MSFFDKLKVYLKESEERSKEKRKRDLERYQEEAEMLRAQKAMLKEKVEVKELQKKTDPPPVKF